MCRTTIPSFLACHKSLLLFVHCNSLHSASTLQANKVTDVEVNCEQIAVKRLSYRVAYSTRFLTNSFANGLTILFQTGHTNEVAVVAAL